jgi:hypothetical protein
MLLSMRLSKWFPTLSAKMGVQMDRPIIFSGAMVRALLDGRKTQTRRLVKPQPELNGSGLYHVFNAGGGMIGVEEKDVPAVALYYVPYAIGDRLWVREGWRVGAWNEHNALIAVDYLADNFYRREWLEIAGDDDGSIFERLWQQSTDDAAKALGDQDKYKWEPGSSPCRSRPSIHMPRSFSRLTLLVSDVSVQRLQDISESDAMAEGCAGNLGPNPDFPDEWDPSPQEEFRDLWNSLHGDGAWQANPWVCAISFSVVKANIDTLPKDEAA